MAIRVIPVTLTSMLPVTGDISQIKIAGQTLAAHLQGKLSELSGEVTVSGNLLPSVDLLHALMQNTNSLQVVSGDQVVLSVSRAHSVVAKIPLDANSLLIQYPWELVVATERLVGEIAENDIQGELKPGVYIDGTVKIGKGTVLLPGVYIEGKATIGENCKIGPNCYIRGNTSIGDRCHVGQAVEIKNSLLMEHASIGHLSYLGDSVICNDVNFGGGTVSSNLRHDGTNHRTMVDGKLLDTGRRKFGTVVGANVHTGIHTTIYPGRKLFANATTLPGEVVDKDKY